jgi:hypothetical protein
MPQQRMLELNCLARGISDIETSSGWVWGLAVNEPPEIIVRDFRKDILKFVADMAATRYQFKLPLESAERFLNLRRDDNSACGFLRAFGVFREHDLKFQKAFPKQIRTFWADAVKKKKTPFALSLSDFWSEHNDFRAFLNIGMFWAQASSKNSLDRKANLQNADNIAGRVVWGIDIPAGLGEPGLLSQIAMRGPFSDKFNGAAIRLDLRDETVLPSIFTLFSLPGLYSHAWKAVLEAKPFGACANCGKFFIVTRPSKTHCSFACKNAAKQVRYRRRQKGR